MHSSKDTICAISTAPGVGGIAVIRISGDQSFSFCNKIFSGDILSQKTMTILFGKIMDQGEILDEVLVSKFIGPRSFTGEDVIEISCHGSLFIQQEILRLLIQQGCRLADHGEFTKRAFLNKKMHLSQAEAVADLIASESAAEHRLAISQMKGGFTKDISELRQKLLDFCSLIELELDFSEEDVAFADRKEFNRLVVKIRDHIAALVSSFRLGNVIKTGIPVAIIGAPNSGKSTLLNALLNEERAIVSAIAGTTRDAIEDKMNIEGIPFRFIDTAGLRITEDEIENKGIELAMEKARIARLVLLLYDASENLSIGMNDFISEIKLNSTEEKEILIIANKCDKEGLGEIPGTHLCISAKTGEGLESLRQRILDSVRTEGVLSGDMIITNARHHALLEKVLESMDQVKEGLDSGLSTDLLAIEIRRALHYLGELTGEISTEDILGNIFSRFCIGK